MIQRIKIFLLILLIFYPLGSQSISQIGYLIKKAIPYVETIAIFVSNANKPKVILECRSATIITQKDYRVFNVASKGDIATDIYQIKKLRNVVVITYADESVITPAVVKFVAKKLSKKKIPLISNRAKDTLHGALLSIFSNSSNIEKHINKIISTAYEINIPEEFLAECVVDAE
jgi:hypothetical protein